MVDLRARRPGFRRAVALGGFALACLVLVGVAVPSGLCPSSHVAAQKDPLTVFVCIEGPADAATFRETGEYVTIWAGEVSVPEEVTITSSNGRQYRLYVEEGLLKSTRLDNGETRTLGEADDALGATSVLAALHVASQEGGIDYQVTDSYFPGMGFFVTSIGETAGSGSVGWSYRVWNADVAASPQVSVERFLLGYESTGLALPHTEVLFYWGYASRCLPLRVTPVQETVQCGYPLSVLVEAFVNDGSLSGYWLPVEGAAVCVGEECRITDEEGIAEVVFSAEGTYYLDARAGYDGDSYYVPAGGRTSVNVHGPCVVVSFTVVDHGDPGVRFGYVVPGTEGTPELGQTGEHGAVTLVVGEETTIDCLAQLRANGGLAGDGTEIALSAITWATDSSGTSAEAMPIDYVTIGPARAGQTTTYDVWHWLSVPGEQPLGLYESRFYYRVTDEEP